MVSNADGWSMDGLGMAGGDDSKGDIEDREVAIRRDTEPRFERRHFGNGWRGEGYAWDLIRVGC